MLSSSLSPTSRPPLLSRSLDGVWFGFLFCFRSLWFLSYTSLSVTHARGFSSLVGPGRVCQKQLCIVQTHQHRRRRTHLTHSARKGPRIFGDWAAQLLSIYTRRETRISQGMSSLIAADAGERETESYGEYMYIWWVFGAVLIHIFGTRNHFLLAALLAFRRFLFFFFFFASLHSLVCLSTCPKRNNALAQALVPTVLKVSSRGTHQTKTVNWKKSPEKRQRGEKFLLMRCQQAKPLLSAI